MAKQGKEGQLPHFQSHRIPWLSSVYESTGQDPHSQSARRLPLLQPQSWSQWAPSVSAVQAVGWLSQAQLLTSRRLETWTRVHPSSHIQERRRRHSSTGDSRHVEALSLRESCTLNNPVHDHLQTIYTLASC